MRNDMAASPFLHTFTVQTHAESQYYQLTNTSPVAYTISHLDTASHKPAALAEAGDGASNEGRTGRVREGAAEKE